jgi:cell division ATPase FtsA
VTLAESVFQMNAAIGHANAISGLAKTLDEPEFATAIGLVKYGAMRQRKPAVRSSMWARIKEFINRLIALMR